MNTKEFYRVADELGRSRLELAGQGVRYSMALRSYSKIKVYVAGTWNDMLDMAIAQLKVLYDHGKLSKDDFVTLIGGRLLKELTLNKWEERENE